MRVDVLPLHERGRLRPASVRNLPPSSRGVLRVFERRIPTLGRSVLCASVVSAVDGLETPLLPELVDAELLWVKDGKLRVRGTELIENVVYGQTWELTVVA